LAAEGEGRKRRKEGKVEVSMRSQREEELQ